jgi:ribosomal protein S18 acetylase RimI-like enzyme
MIHQSAEIAIRRASENDIAGILGVWQQAGLTPPAASDSIEGLTVLLREPAAILLVAEFDRRLVGGVIGGWDGWRGNICRLAVLPKSRCRGIAR